MRLKRRHLFIFSFALLLAPVATRAQDIKIATWNIGNFHQHFAPTSQPIQDRELARWVREHGERDNWVAAQVIKDPAFNADVLVICECCEQDELDRFNKNKEWGLGGAYETVVVFPTNSERHQQLGLMLKPGFKIVERRDKYFEEKDPAGQNERGDRLFARGPAFALVRSPSGYQFWVGVTHQKSKGGGGNNVEQTKWRNREAKRTHEIVKELESLGPAKGNGDVVLLGDMNDELGFQEYEQEAGGDTTATLVGPPADGLTLVTKPLIDAGKISFGGYYSSRYRSFIDQIVVTKEMKDQVKDVQVFQTPVSSIASDHYPVYVVITADPATAAIAPAGNATGAGQ
jgi:hypothetical protein